MDVRPRRLRQFGYLCLCTSALLALTLTFGFTSATADRTASVQVSDDETALLGVTDNTDLLTRTPSGTEEAVFFVDDNMGAYNTSTTDDIDATLEAFGNDTDPALGAEVLVRTNDDYDWEVQLQCGTEDRNLNGTATVTIRTTGDVSVELTRTTGDEVEANCSGG